nr:hypothetical protein [Candidatus Sigynarchaeota archaeon]
MKGSKAYILVKTRVGREDAFLRRVRELGLDHDIYSLLGGSGFTYLVEIAYSDWDELDGFVYNLQRDVGLKQCVIDEMRLISHDKSLDIPDANKKG